MRPRRSSRFLNVQTLCTSPRLYVIDHFASDTEVAQVLAMSRDRRALARRGVSTAHDHTGLSCELPVRSEPCLQALARRIHQVVGFDNDLGTTLRFRRYEVGEYHPPHSDSYTIDGSTLIATAMLYLTDTAAGGETVFPQALPVSVQIQPRKGRLVVWFSHERDGHPDPHAVHEALPVERGAKATLTSFIYQPLAYSKTELAALRRDVPAPGTKPNHATFHCINDGVPEETVRLLRVACAERGVDYTEIDPLDFDYAPDRRLHRGALMYRPAVSLAAMRVEQFLMNDGVATFYRDVDVLNSDCISPPLVLERAGVPVPRTIYCATADRAILRGYVERLGGFPVVVKFLGRSRGLGVLRADSPAALFSLIDFALDQGASPLLCSYIADAVHWRLVVIGPRVVAAYRNLQEEDDFRTYASSDERDYTTRVSPRLRRLAVHATQALGLEMGGVDVLEDRQGRLYVLEVNFPSYFAQAQLVAGVDVAGTMLDYLLAKAERLESEGGRRRAKR